MKVALISARDIIVCWIVRVNSAQGVEVLLLSCKAARLKYENVGSDLDGMRKTAGWNSNRDV